MRQAKLRHRITTPLRVKLIHLSNHSLPYTSPDTTCTPAKTLLLLLQTSSNPPTCPTKPTSNKRRVIQPPSSTPTRPSSTQLTSPRLLRHRSKRPWYYHLPLNPQHTPTQSNTLLHSGNTLGAAGNTVGQGVSGITNTTGNVVSGAGKGLGDAVTGVTQGLGDTTKGELLVKMVGRE
jgi:hypothetical protein